MTQREIQERLQKVLCGFIGQVNGEGMRDAICQEILAALRPLIEEETARFRERLEFNVVADDAYPDMLRVVPENEFTAKLLAGELGE